MSFVDFVEDKHAPPEVLAGLLRPAIAANRHTNFGPVSAELESTLHRLNGGGAARACIAVANATLGLQAAVCALENAQGRRLRWAVGDFSFFTAFQGPFQKGLPVACGPDGQIDMAALAALDQGAYDAILATNVFGLGEDFAPLFDFAAARGKVLLVDNAAGFGALAPWHGAGTAPPAWAEVVSLHHTKPWGMGEGGAVFLPADMAPLVRAAVNFGTGIGHPLADTRLCTNGKISEIAAAQCLFRVTGHDAWAPAYREQAARLTALARGVGLAPVAAALPARAVPGQVAFTADRPVPLEALENPHFRILKYYRPGPGSGAVARDLYARILNLPCHGGMAAVPDATVTEVLRGVLAAS